MSFSYKTKNLGLPVWGSNDKPTQDDLNYQNNQIDKKFNEKPFYGTSYLKNIHGDFISLEINNWGYVTASGPEIAIITGTYTLNPRVKVIITLTIND